MRARLISFGSGAMARSFPGWLGRPPRMGMRRLLPLLVYGILAIPAPADDTPESFCQAIQAAIADKDSARLVALTDGTGLTPEDRARQPRAFEALLGRGQVYAVSLAPLPEDFPPFLVAQGKRHEPTQPPVGVATITFRQSDGLTSEQVPYAIVGGKFRLVSTKTTDLPWTGPPDVPLTILVTGTGAENATLHVRYNASGVEVSAIVRGPSATLWGQHFDGVVATTEDAKSDLGLTLGRAGTEIFKITPGARMNRVEFQK